MSGLHVYCVVAADSVPPAGLAGLDGRVVGARNAGPVAAWTSELDAAPAPEPELLRVHHDVVLAAFRAGDVLPVRFGQWLPDAHTLTAWLEREGPAMRSAMERVRDAVEFGVRVVGGEPEPAAEVVQPEADGPRDYLRTLARRRAGKREAMVQRDSLVGRLGSAVGQFVREQRIVPPAPGDLAAVAHLVDRAQVEPYREAVARFFEPQAPLRAEVTGPWPPWSFVT